MAPKKDTKGKNGAQAAAADFNQPVIVNNSKSTFSDRLDKAKDEHRGEIDAMIADMEKAKKENERLRRQQEDTYGITIDTVERMRQELERARTTRMFLLEDISIRKDKSEKMEAEIFELNMKLESYTRKLNDFRRQQIEWEENSEKLERIEERCERLTKANKNMKSLLLKHHIDPRVELDAGKRTGSYKQQKKTTPTATMTTTTGGSKTPRHQVKAIPTHSFTHVNKKASRSLDDLSALKDAQDQEEVHQKNALTSRKSKGQVPNPYFGFYTNIHQNRKQIRNKMDAGSNPMQLPKIHAV